MKRIAYIVLAGVVIVGVVVYFVYNKPHRDVASEKPEYTLTADELYDEYEADENAANAKFLDRTVAVTGTISELGTNEVGQTIVVLAAENAMIGGVSATFQNKQDGLTEGQQVQLKCRCTGKLMDVVLTNCTLQK